MQRKTKWSITAKPLLSPLAEKLRNVSAIQGASVFTYNGKKITDIAEEAQWKKEDTLPETETDDLS